MNDRRSHAPVALIHCGDYREDRVHAAVGRGLSLLGGAGQFARVGDKLLLKVNLLAGKAPEKAVSTHPAVLSAVARHFQARDATVGYGDSPGFGNPEQVARRAGLTDVAGALGMPFGDFVHGKTVSFPEGDLIKRFTVAQAVLDCDGLISLPKLKTHGLMRVTGAVKNQFGCIPGLLKGEFHVRMERVERFARMLVDLTRFVRPRLYVMDAILAMEGNGPLAGKPRPIGALLLSSDPVAMDAVGCRLMNLDPELLLTNTWGQKMGLGSFDNIEIVGDALEPLIVHDFKVDRQGRGKKTVRPRFLPRFLKDLMVPRPEIEHGRCTRCGACVQVCPVQPKALSFQEGARDMPPVYAYKACIRCYCCQELCPEGAISIRIPPLGRLIHGKP